MLGYIFPFLLFAGGENVNMSHRPSSVRFTENRGQWDARLLYYGTTPSGMVLLEKTGFCYVLYHPDDLHHSHHEHQDSTFRLRGHAVRASFAGAQTAGVILGENRAPDYANFYLGNDPNKWAAEVPVFGAVQYEGLYRGIDMRVYGSSGHSVKYDLMVEAGADASQIQIQYDGADELIIRNGALMIHTSAGTFTEEHPYAYQEAGGIKKEVRCLFRLNGNRVTFEFPDGYDRLHPLVIDPSVVFSSYTGSLQENWGFTATYDNDGNMYLGGVAMPGFNQLTSGYPVTAGAFQTLWGGGQRDIGISKLSANGSTLLYSTYLGGSGNESPHSLVVDAQNRLIMYGVSYSSNYPTTASAYQRNLRGDGDIVVTKFNATGTALLGSTFIGGSGRDGMNFDPQTFTVGNLKVNYGDQHRGEVVVDAAQNIFVASCTNSPDFPATAGAFQSTARGGQDGCVFKLNADCSQLLYCTYLGGSNDDACYSIELGTGGTVYIAGGTMSTDFPTTAGTIHPTYRGGTFDGFVAQLSATGGQLPASTFIGTAANDQVYFVKLDGSGNVYVTGQTNGAFPVFNAPYSNPNSGQFIVKLNPALTTRIYSTVFGNGSGEPNISPTAFLVDVCENVYVAGWGASVGSFFDDINTLFRNPMNNMPLSSNALQSTTDGNDFYFIVLSKDAQSLMYATYFGGAGDGYINGYEHVDGGTSRFDRRGVIYEAICAGCGGTSLTPTTPGAWSVVNGNNQGCNALGLKIAFNFVRDSVTALASPAQGCAPLTTTFTTNVLNAQSVRWFFGDGASSTALSPTHTYNNTGTYQVMVIVVDSASCGRPVDTAYTIVQVTNSSATADFQVNVQNDCDSALVILLANNSTGATQYLWSFGDGTTSQQANPTHTYNLPGTYTIRLIATAGGSCGGADTLERIVTLRPNIRADFIPQDVCLGEPVLFQNRSGVTSARYQWFFGDGQTSNVFSPSHTYGAAGTYTVTLIATDSSYCNIRDTATRLVRILDGIINADFQVNVQNDCDSALVISLANNSTGATQYLWSFGDGTTSQQANPTHNYNLPGTYTIRLIATAGGSCGGADTLERIVTLRPNIRADFIPQDVCLGEPVLFQNRSGVTSARYQWFFGDGQTSSVFSPSHTYGAAGTYTVTLIATDSSYCNIRDTASRTVSVFQQPVAGFNVGSDTLKIETPVQFSNTSQFYTNLLWNFGDGTTLANQENPVHTFRDQGWVNVCLIAYNQSCADTFCRPLYRTKRARIGIANGFTPNKDGVNDVAQVEGEGIGRLLFRIFNRWGEQVFESTDKNKGWDGYYKGALQEMDTYVYTIDATMTDGEAISLKGNITLLR